MGSRVHTRPHHGRLDVETPPERRRRRIARLSRPLPCPNPDACTACEAASAHPFFGLMRRKCSGRRLRPPSNSFLELVLLKTAASRFRVHFLSTWCKATPFAQRKIDVTRSSVRRVRWRYNRIILKIKCRVEPWLEVPVKVPEEPL